MAVQRLTVAALAGDAAGAVADLFRAWGAEPSPAAVDRFCAALRDNGMSLPVVYFSEWVDRWLMGDEVPGPGAVRGKQFEAACLTPESARAHAARCGTQFDEQQWLAARLSEAAAEWEAVTDLRVVVVIREVFGPSDTTEEEQSSLRQVPAWLASLEGAW